MSEEAEEESVAEEKIIEEKNNTDILKQVMSQERTKEYTAILGNLKYLWEQIGRITDWIKKVQDNVSFIHGQIKDMSGVFEKPMDKED